MTTENSNSVVQHLVEHCNDRDLLNPKVKANFDNADRIELLKCVVDTLSKEITPDNAIMLLKGYQALFDICQDQRYQTAWKKKFGNNSSIIYFFFPENTEELEYCPLEWSFKVVRKSYGSLYLNDKPYYPEAFSNIYCEEFKALLTAWKNEENENKSELTKKVNMLQYAYVTSLMYVYLENAYERISALELDL